jgi:uncharacterized protein (DUF433 family)
MPVEIINNRIDGLRITIYDVVHYLEAGRSAEEIADILSLTPEQMTIALRHIDANREAVMAAHAEIEARIAKGNPPVIQERARAGRARIEALRQNRGWTNGQRHRDEGTPG